MKIENTKMRRLTRYSGSVVLLVVLVSALMACGSASTAVTASSSGGTASKASPASTGAAAANKTSPASSSAAAANKPGQKTPTKITIGELFPNGPMIYTLALERGYLADEGLDRQPKVFTNGPNLLMAMTTGEIDAVFPLGIAPALQAAAQGADIKVLASTSKGTSPIVASKNIKTMQDLQGKVVGTPGFGTQQYSMLMLAAKKYNLKFGKVVNADVTNLPIMLQKGEIDAFTSWEYIAAQAVTDVPGAHYLLKMPVIPNAEATELTVSGKLLREKPEEVKRLMTAYLRGLKYYQEHQADAIKWYADNVIKGKNAEEIAKLQLTTQVVDQPEVDVPSVKAILQDRIASGLIKKESVPNPDQLVSKLIDMSVLHEVENELKGQ